MSKFLDRLLGRPNLEVFAEDVRREFERRGIAPLTYVAASNELRASTERPVAYYLGNIFSDYARSPKADRPLVLQRFVEGMAAPATSIPDDYASARASLMPILRTASETALARLQLLKSGHTEEDLEKFDPARRPLIGGLTIGLAYDTPFSMMRINSATLQGWGVDFQQALDDALQNLRALPEHGGWGKLAGGVWMGNWKDSYESSRLLLTDLIHRLGVDEPVACVPIRELLFVASARDPGALREMARLSREAIETRPRWLGSKPLRLIDERWVVFDPPEDVEQEFHNLATLISAGEYNDQKDSLEALQKRNGIDIFVATVLLFKQEDERIVGAATWTEGVDTLLPVAERIAFNRTSGAEQKTIVVDWAKAVPLVTELMEAGDLDPPRYRVRAFPDDAVWAKLAALSS